MTMIVGGNAMNNPTIARAACTGRVILQRVFCYRLLEFRRGLENVAKFDSRCIGMVERHQVEY